MRMEQYHCYNMHALAWPCKMSAPAPAPLAESSRLHKCSHNNVGVAAMGYSAFAMSIRMSSRSAVLIVESELLTRERCSALSTSGSEHLQYTDCSQRSCE